MLTNQLKKVIENGKFDKKFTFLYGKENLESQKARYLSAIDGFVKTFGENKDVTLYSVAGRTEIAGNHTDHNKGCVVASSLNLDIIAVASKNNDSVIHEQSAGHEFNTVNIPADIKPDEKKYGLSNALIAGVVAGFENANYKVGGFDTYTTSNVLKGSGLSSSAAYEDMIGNLLNYLYNDGKIDNKEIAKISQYSENVYFGKPCGLMDQMACAVGGVIAIDFKDTKAPVVTKMTFDLSGAGYALCITDTGGSHSDLTPDYAAVPAEMKAVAKYFGKEVLREVDENDVLANIPALRKEFGDRAVLRALHFFNENKRVAKIQSAIENGNTQEFFNLIKESGKSSGCYLQNVFTTKNPAEQGISLALILAEKVLGDKGAFRVHGGGFAGTMQAFVPFDKVEEYKKTMESAFGKNSCMVLSFRPVGAIQVTCDD